MNGLHSGRRSRVPTSRRYYDFKLDVAKRVLLGKKCVCDIEKRGGKYGNKLYFDYCNRKWLMDEFSCFLLVFGSI
jgi:hypothetical protein